MATVQTSVLVGDAKKQLDDLLLQVCEELQLTQTRYDLAVSRYEAANRLLEAKNSPFREFRPRIYPQGSMALGTTNKPVDGPHDLDFVLQLDAPHWQWKPLALMLVLYEFFKSNDKYRDMATLKNRVVRLTYADDFYMDILPAYTDVLSGGTCILVPDRELVALCHSNPEGYISWFRNRALSRRRLLLEKAKPVPPQQEAIEKEPLQLSVQLLKRWRDLAFESEELAPISIVLTTLAGMHYCGEESASEALSTILAGIVSSIDRADLNGQRIEVRNPGNQLEDFGERWDARPAAYSAFKQGIRRLQRDWAAIVNGRRDTNKELERLFGEYVRTVLVKQAQRLQEARKAGQLAVTSTGLITGLSSGLTRIPQNTFHGDG
jgi:hypothetical protein